MPAAESAGGEEGAACCIKEAATCARPERDTIMQPTNTAPFEAKFEAFDIGDFEEPAAAPATPDFDTPFADFEGAFEASAPPPSRHAAPRGTRPSGSRRGTPAPVR